VVHRLGAAARTIDEDAQVPARRLLPDEFAERLGPQRGVRVIRLPLGRVEGNGFGHCSVRSWLAREWCMMHSR